MNYILYPGSLPDIKHFTLCSWTRLSQMDQFTTLLSYANSDSNNQIVIVFSKEAGVFVYINNNIRWVKHCAAYITILRDNNFGLRNFQRVSQQGTRVPLLTEPVFKTSKPHEKTRWAGPAEVSHFPLHLLLRSPGKEFALAQLAREILPTSSQVEQGEKENPRAQVLVSLQYLESRIHRIQDCRVLPFMGRNHLFCSANRLKGLCHAVQFILFNFANYSPSIAMELEVSKEITCKWQNQKSETNKYVS